MAFSTERRIIPPPPPPPVVTTTAANRSTRGRFSRTHRGFLNDPERIDTEGVAGELFFAEAFNFPTTLVTERTRQKKATFVLTDGTRVKVCTTRHTNLAVQTKLIDGDRFDVYVLARRKPTTGKVELIGWATVEEVKAMPAKAISRRKNARACHTLAPSALHDMYSLYVRHVPTMRPLL